MTALESFAAAEGVSPGDVTHCVLIGRRNGSDVYAFGYWHAWAYTSGIIECRGTSWLGGKMRYGQDMDVERLTAPTAAATQNKTP